MYDMIATPPPHEKIGNYSLAKKSNRNAQKKNFLDEMKEIRDLELSGEIPIDKYTIRRHKEEGYDVSKCRLMQVPNYKRS